MRMTRLFVLSLSGVLCSALPGAPATAADLSGVWSTDKSVCDKVFVKKGARVSFAQDAFLKGSGFIIEGNEIRGPKATCKIKMRKEDGAVTHMLAACATDIMLSDVQFSLKYVGPDEIARLFPNMPELEMRYQRCAM